MITTEVRGLKSAISDALELATAPGRRLLGLGVDVVHVERFRANRERWGTAFLRRSFTETEVEYCSGKRDPDQGFSGVFAAKEAVFKALRLEWTDSFSWKWIEVSRSSARSPKIRLADAMSDLREGILKADIQVSITHADGYAAAVAVATSSAG